MYSPLNALVTCFTQCYASADYPAVEMKAEFFEEATDA